MNELRATCRFFGPQRLQLKFQHRPTRMDCVSKHRPTADHGVQPIMMVVFDDDIAANHFLRVALEETEHTGVHAPLLVSCKAAIERKEPLRRAWEQPERVHAYAGISVKVILPLFTQYLKWTEDPKTDGPRLYCLPCESETSTEKGH